MKDKHIHIIQKIVANICRFLLAAAFIFSGFVKAVDPLGFQYKIQDYLSAFGMASWFPSFFPLLGGIVLSALEFFIGIALFFGIRRTLASSLALALMIFMTPLTFYLAIFNPVSDCGCFGDAWVLTNWETFAKNVVLLLAAIAAFKGRKMLIRFVSQKMAWLVSLYTMFFVFSLSFYCLDRLPVLDFRPYKIGQNIQEGMTMPEGAKPSVYESIFILEKNGEKKEFTLDNYPDSTWTFVDTRTLLKEKGYEPPIHDFSMMELATGEDITEDVLSDKGYTFLLVAHRIEEADDSNIDIINEIYDYSVEHGYRFYCLTSSPEEQIELWKDKSGAEYPFCQMDDITLKTMVRSNPGLILIKDGTILNKWSDEDIPDEYALTDKLENIPLGQQLIKNDIHTVGYVILWFIIPLLLVLGVDVLVIRRRERKFMKRQQQQESLKATEAQPPADNAK
ncbi:BT_3928 family protein [uncultured Bacteroides sp.]|uniref:BT_3928 family protein n=1 Tax=uncultured Bacteroides sp. TaxID=162156 RepID=UPI0025E4E333|nr:BT_3928 family protein [uncultured Bacteroides sp.]